jgi:hypothetical protein
VIENHRIDPDQAVVTHLAPMNDGVVADGHATTEDQADAGIGMQQGSVLNVGLFTDDDLVRVATKNRIEPNARLVLEDDGTDQVGRICDEDFAFEPYTPFSELVDHQSALPLNSTGE